MDERFVSKRDVRFEIKKYDSFPPVLIRIAILEFESTRSRF